MPKVMIRVTRSGDAAQRPSSIITNGNNRWKFKPALRSAADDFPRGNSAGFQAGISYKFNRWLGVFGDFAGQYSHVADLGPNFGNIPTDSSVYQYMAGPRFTKRTERVNVFVHAMAGGAAGRTSLCRNCRFSNDGFALGGGGGFDLNISPRIAIRPIQMDLIASFAEMLETDGRLGMGIVIRIGER